MSKRRAIALAGGGPAAAIVGAQHQEGQNLFSAIGCGACHTPVLSVNGETFGSLHDGRAVGITDAIFSHDGEAALTAKEFRQLTQAEKRALLNFLSAL